jgi:hypothetical protein
MIPLLLAVIGLAPALALADAPQADLSGWASVRYFSGDRRFDELTDIGGLAGDLKAKASAGNFRAFAEARAYLETSTQPQNTVDPREGYLEWNASDELRLRAGLQLVTWGRTDAVNPTDVMTPRLFGLLVTDPETEERTGTYVVQARYSSDRAGTFELDVVPLFRRSELQFGGAEIGAQDTGYGLEQAGAGIRWDKEWRSIDLGLSYFNGLDPLGNVGLAGFAPIQYFRRIQMFGLDGATTLGPVGLRWETAYTQVLGKTGELGERMDDWFTVVGLDRRWEHVHLLVQGAYKRVFGFDPGGYLLTPFAQIEADSRFFHLQQKESFFAFTARPSVTLFDDNLEAELLYLTEVGDASYAIRPKVSYRMGGHAKVAAGFEWWSDDPTGIFNLFSLNKLAFAELSYFF